jgi:hypothetical protein
VVNASPVKQQLKSLRLKVQGLLHIDLLSARGARGELFFPFLNSNSLLSINSRPSASRLQVVRPRRRDGKPASDSFVDLEKGGGAGTGPHSLSGQGASLYNSRPCLIFYLCKGLFVSCQQPVAEAAICLRYGQRK